MVGVLRRARCQRRGSSIDLERMRAVVVDHHVEVATWIAAELAPRGVNTRLVEIAAQALAEVAAFSPHIVLVEIALKDMSGWQLARRIRRLRGDETPRLIAISALDQPAHVEQSRLAGFHHHLVKPLRSDRLAAAVFGD